MKKYFTFIFGLILFIVLISCGSNKQEANLLMFAEEQVANSDIDNEEAQNNEQVQEIKQAERKLIKEGFVEFETKSIQSTREILIEAVREHNAYISSDHEFRELGKITNTVIVRMPSVNFDAFLSRATKGVEKFDSKDINVKDVTEEFLDIQARLKTKKELEARYIDLLKQAKTIPEVLEIEKQIESLRSEIESIEGRLKYLENRVSYSTLTMTFYETNSNETAFGRKFKKGFRNGWENFVWFFVFLVNLWPFILSIIGIIFGIRAYKKHRAKARQVINRQKE